MRDISSAINIDRLTKCIEEDLDINRFEKSIADYKRVVEEYKSLLNQSDFDIDTDLE